MLHTLEILREGYGFAGYIHAKIIPGISKELIHKIGMVADRISINLEFPGEEYLGNLAPQKKAVDIFRPMKQITETIADRKQLGPGFQNWGVGDSYVRNKDELIPAGQGFLASEAGRKYKERFAPGGQSTQMIIGAAGESDRQIIKASESLYQGYKMKRVYYSAYIPLIESPKLPSLLKAPPLLREHRLYQSDWLLRYYGFSADEIVGDENPFLDLAVDPKASWALRNINLFPIEINKASKEELLRIPGVGITSVGRILRQRRISAIRFDDLKKIGVVLKRAKYFITCCGRYYGEGSLEPDFIKSRLTDGESGKTKLPGPEDELQLTLFN
jgi:putative DNA modification/repair radical SAM protein